jgi:hypothetical protein
MRLNLQDRGAAGLRDASVGPYWFVRDASGKIVLLAHRCALRDAEEYGDFLTCPHGHCDLWEGWRTTDALEICRHYEYEDWPRGRVVFDRVRGRFTVYGDPQIFHLGLEPKVLTHFGIPPDRVHFMEDEHYRSTESLGETQ